MLPQINRIPTRDIPRVMKTGRRVVGQGVTLLGVLPGQTERAPGQPRFAFIVSTKVDKRAVVRNRVRRVLSESVRHLLKRIVPEADGILIGTKDLVSLSQDEVETRVCTLLEKAGYLRSVS